MAKSLPSALTAMSVMLVSGCFGPMQSKSPICFGAFFGAFGSSEKSVVLLWR